MDEFIHLKSLALLSRLADRMIPHAEREVLSGVRPRSRALTHINAPRPPAAMDHRCLTYVDSDNFSL
jgi:hypothetical protein